MCVCAAPHRLEALRLLISTAPTGGCERQVLIADVSRACMHAICEAYMHVKLCEEDIESEPDWGRRGKLPKAMYGTRPAALSRQNECTRRLVEALFLPGKS